MQIDPLIDLLTNEESIIVAGKTYEPQQVQTVQLETGESMIWAWSLEEMWLSVDADSEEVLLFNEIEEDFDISEDGVVYKGEDFELSFQAAGVLEEEGEEIDRVEFKDYEGGMGEILRVIEFAVQGDKKCLIGKIIPEEEVQPLS